MLKRTLIVVPLTFALIMSVQPLQSVHGVLMTETELATLDAKDVSAGEASSATESDANEKRGGNSVVRALKAPFKALGRLFSGGKRKENKVERISERDIRNFESTAADPIKANVAVKARAEKISDNSETQPPDHLVLGRNLLNSGSLNEAIAELSVAASIAPSAEAYNLLGLAYDQKGMRDRALSSFENAVRLKNEPEYLNNLGYLLFKNGDYESATKHLKRAAKLAPDNPRIWNNLGLAQTERGHFGDAFKSFARAVGEFKAHVNIAARLESLGETKDAIKHLEKANALKPTSTEVLAKLILLYESSGQKHQAQTAHSALLVVSALAAAPSK